MRIEKIKKEYSSFKNTNIEDITENLIVRVGNKNESEYYEIFGKIDFNSFIFDMSQR